MEKVRGKPGQLEKLGMIPSMLQAIVQRSYRTKLYPDGWIPFHCLKRFSR